MRLPPYLGLAIIILAQVTSVGILPDQEEDTIGPYMASIPVKFRRVIRVLWPRAEWERAACILLQESGARYDAHNTDGEDSRGLYQINVAPGAHPELADVDLYDPYINIAVAAWIWRQWGSWDAWWNASRACADAADG